MYFPFSYHPSFGHTFIPTPRAGFIPSLFPFYPDNRFFSTKMDFSIFFSCIYPNSIHSIFLLFILSFIFPAGIQGSFHLLIMVLYKLQAQFRSFFVMDMMVSTLFERNYILNSRAQNCLEIPQSSRLNHGFFGIIFPAHIQMIFFIFLLGLRDITLLSVSEGI